MVRLIPLKLKSTRPSPKSKCIPPPVPTPSPPATDIPSRAPNRLETPSFRVLPPAPTPAPRKKLSDLPLKEAWALCKKRILARMANAPKPEPESLPYTPQEWAVLVQDCKRRYRSRELVKCFKRCIQVLDDVKGPVHPAYLIYVSLYAATCLDLYSRLENQCRQHQGRLDLILQAISYYKLTISFMATAKLDAPRFLTVDDARLAHQRAVEREAFFLRHKRPTSNSSSTSNSSIQTFLTSRRNSTFSQSESDATAPGSPCSSITSAGSNYQDDAHSSPVAPYKIATAPSSPEEHVADLVVRPLRIRKKVAFAPTLPTVISVGDMLEGNNIQTNNSHDLCRNRPESVVVARDLLFPPRTSSLVAPPPPARRMPNAKRSKRVSFRSSSPLPLRLVSDCSSTISTASTASCTDSGTSRSSSISSRRSTSSTSSTCVSLSPPSPSRIPLQRKKQEMGILSSDPRYTRRYNSQIDALTIECQRHIENLEAYAAATRVEASIRKAESEYERRNTGLKSVLGQIGVFTLNHSDSRSSLKVHVGLEESDLETKVRLRQVKIEALRKRGDKRRETGGFDGSRYAKLCEIAVDEIGHGYEYRLKFGGLRQLCTQSSYYSP